MTMAALAQSKDSSQYKLLDSMKKTLTTVTVTARQPIVKNTLDKIVYDVANDLSSQGGLAIDVLRKVPQVSVDIDGNVELQGNSNVRFLINGKPSSIFGASLADALQTIPASQIQRIEVMTSPGAKYDLAGTAGIINIVLKKSDKDGLNGSVNASAGTRLQNGSFNLNMRKGSFGMNAFFSGTDQLNSTSINSLNRRSFNIAQDTITNYRENGRSPFVREGYQSGLGVDWYLSPRDQLSVTAGVDNSTHHGSGPTAQDQQVLLSGGHALSDLTSQRYSSSRSTENALDWSLAYKKTFKKEGQELDLLSTTTYGRNSDDATQMTNYPNGEYGRSGSRTASPGKNNETDVSVDYTQPVSTSINIQAGAKMIINDINANTGTDTLLGNGEYGIDAGQTYQFTFRQRIYAAYASADFKLFGGFLDGSAGMRFERTLTSLAFSGDAIPSYNLWAPSLLMEHKLGDDRSLKVAYSYRVERPEYEDLSPFLNIADPHDISTGNPMLKTEIGHKYEVGYSQSINNDANFYAGLFYNYNSNDIQSITTYYPVYTLDGTTYTGLSLARAVNIGSQTTYGASLSGSFAVGKKLNFRSDALLREIVNAMPGQASISGFSYKLNVNIHYQIEPDLAAEIFGSYRSRRIEFQDAHPAFLFYTASVKKQFKGKRLGLGIAASNFVNRYVNQLSTNYGSNFIQNNLRQIPLRSLGVTLSYKFGRSEIKKKQEEETPPVPAL
jgi:outer membrane receptor protein involved in Fe transport